MKIRTPTDIDKARGYSDLLLSAFLQMKQRYAMLHPMLFVPHVPQQYGSYEQQRGFEVIKESLFLLCAQEISKLSRDGSPKTPCISKLIGQLQGADLRRQLRNRYCDEQGDSVEPEDHPEVLQAIKRLNKANKVKRGLEFDAMFDEAVELWAKLSATTDKFKALRDQVSAHNEIQLRMGKYERFDIEEFGISWGELKSTIDRMQEIIVLLGRLIRCSEFAWDHFERLVEKSANGFWRKTHASTCGVE